MTQPEFIPGGEFKEPPPEYADIAGSNAEAREKMERIYAEERERDIARKAELDEIARQAEEDSA